MLSCVACAHAPTTTAPASVTEVSPPVTAGDWTSPDAPQLQFWNPKSRDEEFLDRSTCRRRVEDGDADSSAVPPTRCLNIDRMALDGGSATVDVSRDCLASAAGRQTLKVERRNGGWQVSDACGRGLASAR
jgi:hypothetical protein